ncbi:helix-turn-helix domain-containing protein [Paraburkholderia sp. SIMBA_027]|uniref:helix-turn-helix domain-containing protein n=1 Tax=Paraburkholderia sp. SIMBA_027 TaxID=3085770 RepID=UPI00397B9E2A
MKPWTWRHAIIKSGLPPTTRHVLLTLSCHLNDLGEDCFPSTAMLADETGLSERAVCTHLAVAAEKGWFVVRKHGYGKKKWARNEYFPRIPEGFEIPDRAAEGTERGSVPSKKGQRTKALKDVQRLVDNSGEGTEGGSVPSGAEMHEGTEPNDVKALNDVQSNTAVNPSNKSSSNACEENPAAAAAAQKISNDENADEIAEPDAEATLLAVLEQCAAVVVDPKADRVLVLTWVGKGVTAEQLREAVRRAAKRREQASDSRPVYAAFLDRFVTEVLAGGARADAQPASADWWLSDSGIGEQAKRVRVERRVNESTPDFLVRVAKASGRGPWIDHVLTRERGAARFPEVCEFLADVLPADFYPS